MLNSKEMLVPKVLYSIIGLLILLIVIIAFFILKKPKQDSVDNYKKVAVVNVIHVKPGTVADKVIMPARVEPFKEVEISSEKGGKITDIFVDKGEVVKKGQLLLYVDSRVWSTYLRQAEIEKDEAEKTYKRWEALKKTGSVSESDFDNIKAHKDMTMASYQRALADFDQCKIYSPIDGVVDASYMDKGEYVKEGMPLFKIININKIKISLDIPEREIAEVEKGEEILFRLNVDKSRILKGKVSFIARQANSLSGSFLCEIIADNKNDLIRAGMIAEVIFVRKMLNNAIVIPLSAIIPHKGEHIVFIVEKGHAVRRVVKIASWMGSEALISSGVNMGDKVVIRGHRSLYDGDIVNIVSDTL